MSYIAKTAQAASTAAPQVATITRVSFVPIDWCLTLMDIARCSLYRLVVYNLSQSQQRGVNLEVRTLGRVHVDEKVQVVLFPNELDDSPMRGEIACVSNRENILFLQLLKDRNLMLFFRRADKQHVTNTQINEPVRARDLGAPLSNEMA